MQHPSSRPMVLRGSFIFLIIVTKKKGQIFRPFTVKDNGSEYFGNFWRFCSDFETLLVQNDHTFKAGYEHNGEPYMYCWKTVKNNIIGKLHFFLTLIILISSDCTFLSIRIFFSFSSLNCSLNGLRQDMRKVSSPNWKRMLNIVIQHLQLTRLRHRTPSSGYIINLLRTCFL